MKNKIEIFAFVLALLGMFSMSSCQKMDEGYDYLRIDKSSYMFKSNGSDTCRIGVESNAEWRLGELPEWIEIAGQGDDYVELVAKANDTKKIRMADIVFESETESPVISVSQTYEQFNGRFYDLTEYMAPVMSRNGMYVAGMRGRLDETGTGQYTPVIINTYTGEKQEWKETSEFNGVQYISNDGKVVVLFENYSGRTEMFIDGEMIEVNLPDGYFNYRIYSASDDNTIWVGFCQNQTTHKYYPVKWTNGEPEFLDSPEDNLCRQGKCYNGVMARGCSSDGSVIYGSEWDYMGLVYWKDDEMVFLGGDPAYNLVECNDLGQVMEYSGIIATASCERMSYNGRYISTSYFSLDDNHYPVMIDVETGNVEIQDSFFSTEGGGTGVFVTDDGKFFSTSPYRVNTSGFVSQFGSDPVPVTDWLASEYGMSFVDGYTVSKVSSDGNVVFGARAKMTVYGVMYSFWCVATDVFEE